MEIIGPEWLQFGAFGLLAVILYFVAKWFRARTEAECEAQAKRDAKSAQRMDDQQAFLKQLVTIDRQQLQEEKAVWQEMVSSDIKTREQVVVALRSINGNMQKTIELADARHADIMTELKKAR